ncbi:PH domain-containing protein [Georgenia sp. SYP-B2076]|uniref:PH domain-containing protein n=1 Tax=Georgenia sp. SYP-B2076 TaxID=2495881 RepID=UPI001F0CAD22|nr:PH domain-containing protein [Georgenia sp. SYP-B2076]
MSATPGSGVPHGAGPALPHDGGPLPHDGGPLPHDGGAPGQGAPREPAWRRVHKITPVLNAWKVIVAVLAFLAWQLTDDVTNLPAEVWDTVAQYRARAILAVVGGLALIALVATVYSLLSWRRMRFTVGEESIDLHTGILFRQERHARLNRVQAIDVVQPLLGRLFGLAQVRVETAGSGGSNVVIGYLREADAQDLRNEIMARTAGAPMPVAGSPVGVARPVVAAPEREIVQVPAGRIVGSLLLSGSMIMFVLVMAVLVTAAIITRNFGPFVGAFPAVLGWGGYLWSRFAGEFGFRAAISPDGIRLRHGLLETRTQTLPPGRVQAVVLSQPLLWRRRGWWRVEVNVAGYGINVPGNGGAVETVLLPVGSRGEALTALWLVLPDLGVDEAEPVLDAALEGHGGAGGFLTSPRASRWLDPLTWRRNGLRITRTALLVRRGRLARQLAVVPHERTQSLALQQGPLERRLGVADLHAHSVPGPVTAVATHLEAHLAGALLLEQAHRARGARAAEGLQEWQRRVGAPPAGSDGAEGAEETPAQPGGTAPGSPVLG